MCEVEFEERRWWEAIVGCCRVLEVPMVVMVFVRVVVPSRGSADERVRPVR